MPRHPFYIWWMSHLNPRPFTFTPTGKESLENHKCLFTDPLRKNTHHCYLHFDGPKRQISLSNYRETTRNNDSVPRRKGQMDMGDITPASPLCSNHTDLFISRILQAYFHLRNLCASSSVVQINTAFHAKRTIRANVQAEKNACLCVTKVVLASHSNATCSERPHSDTFSSFNLSRAFTTI